ncbi:glycosyltransferase [Bacteroides thetaiotaomicron]|uniref:glycosyltransferase n=1 Tax=Bacteroides thetaiotaomicron TaxID=818 RepID=UPI0040631931
MKLLVSDATFGPGGAERVLSILSKSFADNYETVIYITWIDVPDFYVIDDRVKRVCIEKECGSTNLIKKMLWFRRYVQQLRPDLVLSFLTPYNVIVSLSLTGVNVAIVVAERNDPNYVWNSFIKRNIRKIAYQKPKGILVQTEKNKVYFKDDFGSKIFIIFNPIIMDENYRGKALKTEKKNRIVSVSRLMKQKNQNMLLRAFKFFHDSHSDYTLTIYGKGSYRSEVEKLIASYELQDFVELPGATENIWDQIADAKCFVLSSWYEGMPNGLLEALCLGLPCISTKVSGATDLIQHGKNGYLVDLDNSKELAKYMSILVENPEFQISIGQKATQIYELLKVDVISQQWINYINKITNQK